MVFQTVGTYKTMDSIKLQALFMFTLRLACEQLTANFQLNDTCSKLNIRLKTITLKTANSLAPLAFYQLQLQIEPRSNVDTYQTSMDKKQHNLPRLLL